MYRESNGEGVGQIGDSGTSGAITPESTRPVSIEDMIDSYQAGVLRDEKASRLGKLKGQEWRRFNKYVSKGREKGLEGDVEGYMRENRKWHFIHGHHNEEKLEKAFAKRKEYEEKAGFFYKTGDEILTVERLVAGHDIETGLMSSKMNRTFNRFELLNNYFSQDNMALEVSDEADYSRLTRVRDSLSAKLKSWYWRKGLGKKEGHDQFMKNAQFVLGEMNRHLIAYETREAEYHVAEVLEPLDVQLLNATGEEFGGNDPDVDIVGVFDKELLRGIREKPSATNERPIERPRTEVLAAGVVPNNVIEFPTRAGPIVESEAFEEMQARYKAMQNEIFGELRETFREGRPIESQAQGNALDAYTAAVSARVGEVICPDGQAPDPAELETQLKDFDVQERLERIIITSAEDVPFIKEKVQHRYLAWLPNVIETVRKVFANGELFAMQASLA